VCGFGCEREGAEQGTAYVCPRQPIAGTCGCGIWAAQSTVIQWCLTVAHEFNGDVQTECTRVFGTTVAAESEGSVSWLRHDTVKSANQSANQSADTESEGSVSWLRHTVICRVSGML